MLFPPGIKNCGNLCFANSILQCLLSQRIFKKAFTEFAEHHTNHCADCMPGKGSLAMILILLILFILLYIIVDAAVCAINSICELAESYEYSSKRKVLESNCLQSSLPCIFNELLSSDIIVLHVFLSCSNSSITHFWRAV